VRVSRESLKDPQGRRLIDWWNIGMNGAYLPWVFDEEEVVVHTRGEERVSRCWCGEPTYGIAEKEQTRCQG
jgi:hypothetical protein